MGTVTITGAEYEIYGTLAEATSYIGAKFGPQPAKWRGLSTDDQGRTLVEATRYLDALGLVDGGTAIGHDTTIPNVLHACYEFAVLVAADPRVLTALDSGSNVKKLDADGTSIEYFAPTSLARGTATRLPAVVQRLLADYLPGASASSSATVGGASFGTSSESWFDDCDAMDRTEPA